MSMRSTFRGASAAFAAALVLASCGATGGEVSTPTETPTHAPETAKPSPTQIPSAKETDKPSAEPSASEDASATPSESPSPTASSDSEAKVGAAPAIIAHFTEDTNPEIGDFPFTRDVIATSISSVFDDGGEATVECDGDIDITAGKPKTHCTVTTGDRTREAYAYGTFSNVQGPGLLVAFDNDFDASLSGKFTEPGTEVLAYGIGDMWAVDSPVDGAAVSEKALKAMQSLEMPISKFECAGEMSIAEGRNSQVCPIEAEWGKAEATVIAATILNSQDSGVLVVTQVPTDD